MNSGNQATRQAQSTLKANKIVMDEICAIRKESVYQIFR